jgi:hypothetical protein
MKQFAVVASVCHKKLAAMERETVGMAPMNLVAVSTLDYCSYLLECLSMHTTRFVPEFHVRLVEKL